MSSYSFLLLSFPSPISSPLHALQLLLYLQELNSLSSIIKIPFVYYIPYVHSEVLVSLLTSLVNHDLGDRCARFCS